MDLKHGTSTGRGATVSAITARGERRAARWLTRADLCRRLKISRATSYRLESEGYLPKPVRIGPGTIRWSVTEIESFERRLLNDRGAISVAEGSALGLTNG
jgi:predicted DNA-binding transcriptional regulator AlpA